MKAQRLCSDLAKQLGGTTPVLIEVKGRIKSYETKIGNWGDGLKMPHEERRYIAVMVDGDADGNALRVSISAQIDIPTNHNEREAFYEIMQGLELLAKGRKV